MITCLVCFAFSCTNLIWSKYEFVFKTWGMKLVCRDCSNTATLSINYRTWLWKSLWVYNTDLSNLIKVDKNPNHISNLDVAQVFCSSSMSCQACWYRADVLFVTECCYYGYELAALPSAALLIEHCCVAVFLHRTQYVAVFIHRTLLCSSSPPYNIV